MITRLFFSLIIILNCYVFCLVDEHSQREALRVASEIPERAIDLICQVDYNIRQLQLEVK